MARERRRRDQIWNPPSRGSDIGAIFVLFAAGPLLLPLVGAQLEVIAFAAPLVFCLFAAWRCSLAARRNPERTLQRWAARVIAGTKRAGTNDGSVARRSPAAAPKPTEREPGFSV